MRCCGLLYFLLHFSYITFRILHFSSLLFLLFLSFLRGFNWCLKVQSCCQQKQRHNGRSCGRLFDSIMERVGWLAFAFLPHLSWIQGKSISCPCDFILVCSDLDLASFSLPCLASSPLASGTVLDRSLTASCPVKMVNPLFFSI